MNIIEQAQSVIDRIEALGNEGAVDSETQGAEVALMQAAIRLAERGNMSEETRSEVESWVHSNNEWLNDREGA